TQQRGIYAAGQIQTRTKDVTDMYSNPSLDAVLPELRKYDVRYIYVGGFERESYPQAGIDKFSQPDPALSLVYNQDGVQIYQVNPA
ncbi:MAG TPA: hypothetical protein VFS62_17180, partial [Chloroflexota bacterium]|nr:hypothetical protein [Chloroflexota bacterium]